MIVVAGLEKPIRTSWSSNDDTDGSLSMSGCELTDAANWRMVRLVVVWRWLMAHNIQIFEAIGWASSVMAGGLSGHNHVSVSMSTSSWLSLIKSWMRAALLRADLALRQPKVSSFTAAVFTVVTGPGLISTSPDIRSKSETMTVAGRRAVRGRSGTEPAGRLHSSTDAD